MIRFLGLVLACFVPTLAIASSAFEGPIPEPLDLTGQWVGYASLIVFAIAYIFVILEEQIHLRKSKPVLMAAGIIWILIAFYYNYSTGSPEGEIAGYRAALKGGIEHNFLEYAQLFFFLLVAMTYINAMLERGVFDELRRWLTSKAFSYRQLFWLTGFLAFFISPIADNLTTALIMCAVIMAVANGKKAFVGIACINIVVAANAGGAFSPFGDITTLMVWQAEKVSIEEFLVLFLPSLVNFIVPAGIMHFAIPKGVPDAPAQGGSTLKYGGMVIVGLFLLTVLTAVLFHLILHLAPVFGMMVGLGYLKLYGFYLRHKSKAWTRATENPPSATDDPYDFDVFSKIAGAEWDTLFFFYGVILAVGGLGYLGYLSATSAYMYGELGATYTNILVGILSAIVDNIPVMFAVLTMDPTMLPPGTDAALAASVEESHFQWLLVTLTAGVGGSLLSVGSAAGVALMGQARGQYTFFGHLKWMPVIALGYAASIVVHFLING